MAKTFNVKIDYVHGESDAKTLRRVSRAIEDAKQKNGVRNARPSRNLNEIIEDLKINQRATRITLTETRSGLTARRYSPGAAIEIADATGALDLEAAAKKITPELTKFEISQIAGTLGARKMALDTALYGRAGLNRDMRMAHMGGSTEDDSLAAKIIGYEPNRASKIDSQASARLKNLIKRTMLDIGVEDDPKTRQDDVKEIIEAKFRSKYRLLDQDILNRFTMMIKAHHEIRIMNKAYMMSMMTGMQGSEFPDTLLSMLSPSPDDFLQGTDAMVIIDTKVRPNIPEPGYSDIFSNAILSIWNTILNTGKRKKPVKVTDMQKSVASLLEHYNYDRKRMVKEIEAACRQARRKGGDFLEAFTAYPYADLSPASEQADEIRELVVQATQVADDEDPMWQLKIPESDDAAEKLLEELDERGMAVRIGESEFFIVPISMPRFKSSPVGWDRRWMVSTMRVVDEYWELIYGDQGLNLHDLLYLIASRTQELFDYSMDSEDLLLLAILLTGDAERRERPAEAEAEEEAEAEAEAEEEAEEEEEEEEEEMEDVAGEGAAEAVFGDVFIDEEVDEDNSIHLDEEERRARRAGRGILPKVAGRPAPLTTIGDMIGISDAISNLRQEVIEEKRQADAIKQKLEDAKTAFQEEKENLESSMTLMSETQVRTTQELESLKTALDDDINALKGIFSKHDVGDMDSILDIAAEAKKDLDTQIAKEIHFKRQYKKRLSPKQKKALIQAHKKELNDATKKLENQIESIEEEAERAMDEARAQAKLDLTAGTDALEESRLETENALKLIADLQSELQFVRDTAAPSDLEDALSASEARSEAENVVISTKGTPFDPDAKPTTRRKVRKKKKGPIKRNPPASEITITRADGTTRAGRDIGLVTAEVMVGVNIVSDIKTGIRDLFGGRAKSGEVKLQRSMKILVDELKSRAAEMGATHITNFHAEPFAYGSQGSIIAIYGFGTARKGAGKKKAKSNPPSLHPTIPDEDIIEAAKYIEENHPYIHLHPQNRGIMDELLAEAIVDSRLTSDSPLDPNYFVIYGHNGFYWVNDDSLKDYEGEGKHHTVKSFNAEYPKEWVIVGPTGWWPFGKPAKTNAPKKTYKGLEITGKKGAWEVEAYGRTFKTLQQARDFIAKKAKGSAKPNQRCPMVFKGKQCTGIVVAITPKANPHTWKCKQCNHKFKEA